MTALQTGMLIAGVLAVGGMLAAGMMVMVSFAGEENHGEDVAVESLGITPARIAELTLSAWADCGTRTAIEIAAREAYAAGVRDTQQAQHQPISWSAEKDAPELYFLQDKRSYVGNCPMWWAKDGNGYTTRIDLAQRYTKEKAFTQHRSRESDIPWPCSIVEPLQRPTIDMQDLHKTDYFIAALTPAGKEQP